MAQYVMTADLGRIENGIQHRWAHNFLRSLKVTLRRMHRTCNSIFTARTFEPTAKRPTRGPHLNRKQSISMRKAQKKNGSPKPRPYRFKYRTEVPRNWKDII